MLEKNGKSYDFFTCQNHDSAAEERKKYKEKAEFWAGSVGGLPEKVGELTKQEILDYIHKLPNKGHIDYIIISASPAIDNSLEKYGKKFTVFLCQKLDTLIEEVSKLKERPLFCDRIEVLPTNYDLNGGLTNSDITHLFHKFPFMSSYTYIMVTENKK